MTKLFGCCFLLFFQLFLISFILTCVFFLVFFFFYYFLYYFSLLRVCSGEDKPTNTIRVIMNDIHRGVVPSSWLDAYQTEELIVSVWMTDLMKRLNQLSTINVNDLSTIWLGGLFNPGAFVAATRQQTAAMKKCSLEDLTLTVSFGSKSSSGEGDSGENGYVVKDLVLEGGASINEEGRLKTSPVMRQSLSITILTWQIKSSDDEVGDDEDEMLKIELPLYLNGDRSKIITTLNLKCERGINPDVFSRRGTAIIGWSE